MMRSSKNRKKESDTIQMIKPSRGWPAINIKELVRYKQLLYFLAWIDIKVR